MQAIARWGNFFNQELYGPPTKLPWGIPIDCAHRIAAYPCSSAYPEATLFHPLFLYESLSGVVGALAPDLAGFHAAQAAAPGRPPAALLRLVRDVAVRPRDVPPRQLDVLRGPDRADRVAALRDPVARDPGLAPSAGRPADGRADAARPGSERRDHEQQRHDLRGRDPEERPVVVRKVSRTKRTMPYQTKKSSRRSPGRSDFRAWNPSQIRASAPSTPDSDSYRKSGWKSVDPGRRRRTGRPRCDARSRSGSPTAASSACRTAPG